MKTEAEKGRSRLGKWLRFAVVGAAALVALEACTDSGAKGADPTVRSGGTTSAGAAGAPEFPAGLPRLNMTAPLTMKVLTLAPARIAPGRGEVRLSVQFPEGYAPNAQATSEVEVRSTGAVSLPGASRFHAADPHFPMSFPALFAAGTGEVTVDLSIVYCRDQQASMCLIKQVRLVVPVTVIPTAPSGGGALILEISYRVQLSS